MTVNEQQVDAFIAALPYRDFRDRDLARATIAAVQRGSGLSAATSVLLAGHEPNWLPGVEAMVGGALNRAGVAPSAAATTTATDEQIDAFLRALAVWTPYDPLIAREAIEAASRWGDDGLRVAAGIVLAGEEVADMPGHEMAVAQALNAATSAADPRAEQYPAAMEGSEVTGSASGRPSPDDRAAALIARELRGLRGAIETLTRAIERRE